MLCYSNRAATRISLGKMRDALKDCLMAAAIDPNFLNVQVSVAHCYLAIGEVENATLQYMKCLQFGNDVCVDRKLLVEASEGLAKEQKVTECIKQYTELPRRTSNDLECALRVINEALKISNFSEQLLQMKADILIMLRRYEQVIQMCEQTPNSAEVDTPTSPNSWRSTLIVKSYFYLGRLEEALEFIKKQETSGQITERLESMSFDSVIPLANTVRELLSRKVDVQLEVVHLTDEYWDKVVSYLIDEYKCGCTPNPDVLCNTRIKFGAFMDAISNMDFDFVASGHHAKVVHPITDETNALSFLQLSKDMVKDQTYFLSYLSQAQLKRLVLPLGCIPKDEVRKLARKFDLPNQERMDSQGICFLGKIKFSEFVGRHIGEKEGILLEAETGDLLAGHRGFWFYTIGQRQGLGLAGGPWYVVEKDVKNNMVFVSRNYYSVDKRRRSFRVGSFRWISGSPPRNLNQLRCKVRHGPVFYDCTLHMEKGTENIGTVQLHEDDQGLAAGQFAAFYEEEVCVGSGVILESWDDKGFPVCDKAREIAKMEDKSKLGKPVKIKPKPEDCIRDPVVKML